MLAFRIVKIFFSVASLFLFVCWLLWDWPLWYLLVCMVVYLLIVAYGSYNMRLNFFIKAYHRGPDSEPKIALTFDDGPSADYTPVVLDLLKKYNARATFFCIGKNIIENQELLARIHQEGHIIGNHSFSHAFFFDFYSKNKVVTELQNTNDLIFNITGKVNKIFRPPYGITNPPISRAVKKLGLKMIGWSIRSYDTMNKPADTVKEKILRKLKNGSVVLLHDNRKDTPQILEGILQHASEQTLKCVDICELFQLQCYE